MIITKNTTLNNFYNRLLFTRNFLLTLVCVGILGVRFEVFGEKGVRITLPCKTR